MKTIKLISILLISASTSISINAQNIDDKNKSGAYYTGIYRNLFSEMLGKSKEEVEAKISSAWEQLFYGDNNTQRVYYPAGNDMGYIKDIIHSDVRSEGMSYGMMIAVQLDKKRDFDCLWKWAKTYMQHKSGARNGYFAWQMDTTGAIIDSNSASDGEEWFVTSLFFEVKGQFSVQ